MKVNIDRDEVFYKKVGKKYVPISYYNSNLTDGFTIGSHLVVKQRGVTSVRHNISPDVAPMLAVGILMQGKMADAIHEASEMRPSNIAITQKEADCWEELKRLAGDSKFYIQFPATQDAVEAGIAVLQEEVTKLMANDAIKAAYEHFQFLCELSYAQPK